MAEAENNPLLTQRFFCHSCNAEVLNVTNEFTCPLCSGGFIEELPPAAPSDNNSSDAEMMDVADPMNESFFLTDLNNQIRDQISTMIMSVAGGEDNAQNASGSLNTVGGDGRQRRERRVHRFAGNFDDVLHDFLISIATGAGGATGGGTPLLFMGNPGDYAWGREGLDTIVTQLLNQMDSTGPPPLGKDQIEQIPIVEVTQDQLDMKLQCSVCWEDFTISEKVRQLSCSHVYHETCIFPWLNLHGTCPVCRKSFVPDYTEEQQRTQFSTAAANSIRNVASFIGGSSGNDTSANSTSSDNNSTSQSTATDSSPSTTSQNNSRPRQQFLINSFGPFINPNLPSRPSTNPLSSQNNTSTSQQPSQNNSRRPNNSDDIDPDIVEFDLE